MAKVLGEAGRYVSQAASKKWRTMLIVAFIAIGGVAWLSGFLFGYLFQKESWWVSLIVNGIAVASSCCKTAISHSKTRWLPSMTLSLRSSRLHAAALAYEGCLAGHTVLFTTAIDIAVRNNTPPGNGRKLLALGITGCPFTCFAAECGLASTSF